MTGPILPTRIVHAGAKRDYEWRFHDGISPQGARGVLMAFVRGGKVEFTLFVPPADASQAAQALADLGELLDDSEQE